MKTFLLSIFTFFMVGANAQSTVTVFSEYGDKFFLILNGENQNEEAMAKVTVDGLDQDFYMAVVKFEDESMGSVTQKGMRTTDFDGNDAHITYVLTLNRKGEPKIKYYSASEVGKSEPHMLDNEEHIYIEVEEEKSEDTPEIVVEDVLVEEEEVDTKVESGGRTVIKQTITTKDEADGDDDNVKIDVSFEGMGLDIEMKVDENTTKETVRTEEVTYEVITEVSGGDIAEEVEAVREEEIVESDCMGTPLGGAKFDNLKSSIKTKDFSDSKMTVLKQATRDACLDASQIKELMLLFTFEDDKLNVAKFCYDKCNDQSEYYLINDAFEFEMTIDELNAFISGQNR